MLRTTMDRRPVFVAPFLGGLGRVHRDHDDLGPTELDIDGPRRFDMIRVIKRYESRKLYDTEESRYISLEDISAWVREGQDVKVVDNATSEDVTPQILTQIILDEGKRGSSFLPTELLHDLVRAGEKAINTGVEQVQTRVDHLVQRSIDRLAPVRQARQEMALLRERLGELENTLAVLESDALADAAGRDESADKTES